LYFQISIQSRTYLVFWRASGSKSENPNRLLQINSLKIVIKEFFMGFEWLLFENFHTNILKAKRKAKPSRSKEILKSEYITQEAVNNAKIAI
jgi:hypothetical protein